MKLKNSRIWVAGADGRVGMAMCNLLDTTRVDLMKTDIKDVDITNVEEVKLFTNMNRPDIIINCAGMTDVVRCENEREQAFKVNAIGARNLSTAARKINARLVQISTDDVFDGRAETPYNEFDKTEPITMYGKSKLAGEQFVRELAPRHIIIRSSWLYGVGDNFVRSILRRAETESEIAVSNKQFASPTSAAELAAMIIQLIEHGEDGVYHAVCGGYCSRYEFAQEILRIAGKNTDIIVPAMESQDYSVDMRPSYSVLDNLMLRICEIEEPVHWKIALEHYIQSL